MSDHNVVIEGTILPGFDPEGVRSDLARLTRQSPERVRLLLAGKPVTVKRAVDLGTANSFVRALVGIGVSSRAESIAEFSLDLPPVLEAASAVTFAVPRGLDARPTNHVQGQSRGIATTADAAQSAHSDKARAPHADTPSLAPVHHDADALWQAVAQSRVSYYVPKWKRYVAGESTFPSWHWPAFFLGLLWALYRKAWAGALILFGVAVGVEFLGGFAVGAMSGASTNNGGAVVVLVTLLAYAAQCSLSAMLANALYYRKTMKLIAQSRTLHADQSSQVAYLYKRGGTSLWVPGFVLGGIVLLGLLAAITIPAYGDYTARARVGEAFAAIMPLKTQIEESVASTGRLAELNYDDVKAQPGAKFLKNIEMNRRGVLTITFNIPELLGKQVRLVPSRDGSNIVWTCRNVDTPNKYLPTVCRETR